MKPGAGRHLATAGTPTAADQYDEYASHVNIRDGVHNGVLQDMQSGLVGATKMFNSEASVKRVQ